jgi:palmitoyltransferase
MGRSEDDYEEEEEEEDEVEEGKSNENTVGSYNSNLRLIPEESKGISDNYNDGRPIRHYCTKCKIIQPYRAKHCSQCKKCILKFDHHCFWIGGCVGELNHRKFILYLCLQFYMTIWGLCIANSGLDIYPYKVYDEDRKFLRYSSEYGAYTVILIVILFFFVFTVSVIVLNVNC